MGPARKSVRARTRQRSSIVRSVRLKDEAQCVGESLPRRAFGVELPAAGGGELVEARAAVVLRCGPRRSDPAARLESAEGRVERSIIDVENAARDCLDRLRELPAIRRASAEELENDQIEGALQ